MKTVVIIAAVVLSSIATAADSPDPHKLMACVDEAVALVMATNSSGSAATFSCPAGDVARLRRGSALTSSVRARTTYPYGEGLGVGPLTNLTGWTALSFDRRATVKLVHFQVYEKYGFDPSTAVLKNGINTAPFTELDHEALPRLFEAYGLQAGTLDFTREDSDGDGLPDGWELYVMFGPHEPGGNALCPWLPDGAQDFDRDGLDAVREFDEGHIPTDPWSIDTDADGVLDTYEYLYHLKGTDASSDSDGDGLSNYTEYLISEIFGYAKLDVTNPNTDGTPDFFRRVGHAYLGEIFTDLNEGGLDSDGDGWSNHTEMIAGTDPDLAYTAGPGGVAEAMFPVPTIEAEVFYDGNSIDTRGLVFMAWSEKYDPEMTGVPDAIWTLRRDGASDDQKKHGRYIGRNPNSELKVMLGGGNVTPGSVEVKFIDPGFTSRTISDLNVPVVSRASNAKWYTVVTDKAASDNSRKGHLYDYAARKVGEVDYATGNVRIDFSRLSRVVMANPSYEDRIIDHEDSSLTPDYEILSLDSSFVKFSWTAELLGTDIAGKHYLAVADAVSVEHPHRGRVREGLNSFICFADLDKSGTFTPGEPFGYVKGVDVGWSGAKVRIELSETSAITPRFSPWAEGSDRGTLFDENVQMDLIKKSVQFIKSAGDATNQIAEVLAEKDKIRLRVIRFGVNDLFANMVGICNSLQQRVVLDRTYDRNGRDFIHEGDFLNAGEFDIDWNYLGAEVQADTEVQMALGGALLTNMTYLVVLDAGEVDNFAFFGAVNSSNTVNALATKIERRFEAVRHNPVGDAMASSVYGARPTFSWSIPNEELWAKRFGSSYTAFRLQIFNATDDETSNTTVPVYDTGVLKAPVIKNGKFTWTAPAVLPRIGNWKWRVAMFNAKWKPSKFESGWSKAVSFSTVAVNSAQPMNDNGYSSIDVAVKYTGPEMALANLAVTNGQLIVQAFGAPDFSGEALAQTIITNLQSTSDGYATNVVLGGVACPGSFYVRAFIDSDGDGRLSPFESFGCEIRPVAVQSDTTNTPVTVYIQDVDTDGDAIPDALEYASYGSLTNANACLMHEGSLVFDADSYSTLTSGVANVSSRNVYSHFTLLRSSYANDIILQDRPTVTSTVSQIRFFVNRNIESAKTNIIDAADFSIQ